MTAPISPAAIMKPVPKAKNVDATVFGAAPSEEIASILEVSTMSHIVSAAIIAGWSTNHVLRSWCAR
jgi:hypothetical protein